MTMEMTRTMSRPESNDKKPSNERMPTATMADIGRAMRLKKQEMREKYISELQTGPDVYARSPSPAEIKQPVFTHELAMDDMTLAPVELATENTAPQESQVFVLDEAPEPAPNVDYFAVGLNNEPKDAQPLAEEEPAPNLELEVPTVTPEEQPAAEAVVETEALEVPAQVQAPVEAPVKEPVVAPAETIPVVPVVAAEVTKDADTIPEDVIPEDVVAEVASTLKRADFVKQQEEAWGANDDIKPEDIPEGEMTYEQYLAQRPVAQEGDSYHENGRVHDATTGKFANKEAYVTKLENSTEEYDQKNQTELNRADVIDDAVKENEIKDESNDKIIRTNVEGEFLVEKDARLRGLLGVGNELLALYNSKLTGEEFEKTIRPALEEKQAIYDDLYELYENKGLDNRALWYIQDKTGARVEDPEFVPVEGSAYINGEKVDILDFVETSDGKKAYTIEKADGSIEAVYSDEVAFKREFEKYEAPEVEPEENLSRFERVKKWFGKERKKIQEFHGKAYFGTQWTNALSVLSRRKMYDTMSPEQEQLQKLKNRRNLMLGFTVLTIAGAAARTMGLGDVISHTLGSAFDGFGSNGLGHNPGPGQMGGPEIGHADGLTADFIPHAPAAADNADLVPMRPGIEGGADVAPLPEIGHADGGADFVPDGSDGGGYETGSFNVDNPAFNIPSGGGGLELFHELGLGNDQWTQHAPELLQQFPDVLYIENGDIRFVNEGFQPLEFRQAVAAITNS